MVKKLVWYYYRKTIIFEIASYIFIAVAVGLAIATLITSGDAAINFNIGSFAYFGFVSFGGQYMIQDRYFVHTLPVERDEYMKAAKIYSFIVSLRTLIFLLASGIIYGTVYTRLLYGYAWYLPAILWILVLVTCGLIYYYMISAKVSTFVPIDKDNKKKVRSTGRMTYHIGLIVLLATVMVIGVIMMGNINNLEVVTKTDVYQYFYIVMTAFGVSALLAILGIYEMKRTTKRSLNYFEVV